MNWYKTAQLDFYQEAKKYNNVDDFIASFGSPFYHGTASKFDEFDINLAGTVKKSDWGKGIYLERSKRGADYYRAEAAKYNNEEYQNLYEKYDQIVRNLPPVSDFNSTPAYTEESMIALKDFQNKSEELKNNKELGSIMKVYMSPQAKIMKHNVVDGMTDPFLSERAIDKGYDVILVDEGMYMEEIVVVNPNVIKTEKQLIDIWNQYQGI